MESVLLHILSGSLLVLIMTITTTSEDVQLNNVTSEDPVVKMIQNAFPKDYNRNEDPQNVTIYTRMQYVRIQKVDILRMEVEVEFLLNVFWKDDRLILDKHLPTDDNTPFYFLPSEIRERLWVPLIDFPRCKLCKDFTLPGNGPTYLMDGKLYISYRDIQSFSCPYDLAFYPFDVHTCSINLELIGDETVQLRWDKDFQDEDHSIGSEMPGEFRADEFFVKQICLPSVGQHVDTNHCLQYGIRFHRTSAYYLMLIYTPSFFIVVISWLNFWFPTDATAPRVTLGLTSLVTVGSQFATSLKDLPHVTYIKALDVWMIVCVVMVFGSLLEFTLAHNTKVQPNAVKPAVKRKEKRRSVPSYTATKLKRPMVAMKSQEVLIKVKKVNPLDAKSRVFFPVIFLIFNMIYWPYYGRGG